MADSDFVDYDADLDVGWITPTQKQIKQFNEVFHCQQTGTVTEFAEEFEKHAHELPHMPSDVKVRCFVAGLKKEIECVVRSKAPVNTTRAYKLALIEEMNICAKRIEENTCVVNSTKRHSQEKMAAILINATISLKLFVDTNSKKVLFAEAGKDFVDFLFGLLQLPVGAMLALLTEDNIAGSGSFGKIYDSIRNLNTDYLQPNQSKDTLLKPEKASSRTKHSPLLNVMVYHENQDITPNFVDGYVIGEATYMVMDDLAVKPISNISSIITLLNTLRVKDVGSIEEKTVQVDMKKGLELLKASFVSTTILTDLFFQQKDTASEGPGWLDFVEPEC